MEFQRLGARLRVTVTAVSQPVADLSQLAQLFYLFAHVDLVDLPAIEGLYDTFRHADSAEDQHFVLVIDINVKTAPRIDPPIPLRFPFQHPGTLDLALQLDYQVLKQMWNLRGLALAAETEAVLVVAAMPGQVWKQLEQEFWNVWSVLCGVAAWVGHLDHQLDAISVIEEDFNYLQLAAPQRGITPPRAKSL